MLGMDCLRAVVANHIAAWHVRGVDRLHTAIFYQNRFVDEPELFNLGKLADLIHATINANNIPAFAIFRMRSGYSKALQVALVAMCPHLHSRI